MQAVVVPILRSYWLWYPRATGIAEPASRVASWRTGRNLEEKVQLLGEQLKLSFQGKLAKEWNKLETAKPGTFRNRGYKLALAVLAREDPQETFLKAIPSAPMSLNIAAPDAYSERLVRRRLRVLAASSAGRHRTRMVLWLLALIPQLPVLVTPLPAITIYYSAYRFYSHYRALHGCQSLRRLFLELDVGQLSRLREQLLAIQAGGLDVEPATWVAKLLQPKHQYTKLFETLKHEQRKEELARQRLNHTSEEEVAVQALNSSLIVELSPELTRILQPSLRRTEALDDGAAAEAARLLDVPLLPEAITRARKRVESSAGGS